MTAKTGLKIGKNLRAARHAMGYSLTELSRRANVSKAYLSQIENNRQKQPSAEIVFRLARALQINISALLGVPDGLEDEGPNQEQLAFDGNSAAAAAQPAPKDDKLPLPLPVPLQIFWAENPKVPVADIKMLARLSPAEWQPATPTDYWFIYQTIKAAAAPYR